MILAHGMSISISSFHFLIVNNGLIPLTIDTSVYIAPNGLIFMYKPKI